MPDREQRLRILLFLLQQKLEQRRSLRHKANVSLALLMAMCLAAAVFCPYFIRWFLERDRSYWTLAYFAALAIGPFAIAVINYFWTTFAQILIKGTPYVRTLLQTPQYAEFEKHIHLEMLMDDWSLPSLILNILAVDVGLSSSLLFMCAVLVLLGPPAVQAGLSVAVVYVLFKSQLTFLAAGLAVLYLLFFILTGIKSWSFYKSLRRGTEESD